MPPDRRLTAPADDAARSAAVADTSSASRLPPLPPLPTPSAGGAHSPLLHAAAGAGAESGRSPRRRPSTAPSAAPSAMTAAATRPPPANAATGSSRRPGRGGSVTAPSLPPPHQPGTPRARPAERPRSTSQEPQVGLPETMRGDVRDASRSPRQPLPAGATAAGTPMAARAGTIVPAPPPASTPPMPTTTAARGPSNARPPADALAWPVPASRSGARSHGAPSLAQPAFLPPPAAAAAAAPAMAYAPSQRGRPELLPPLATTTAPTITPEASSAPAAASPAVSTLHARTPHLTSAPDRPPTDGATWPTHVPQGARTAPHADAAATAEPASRSVSTRPARIDVRAAPRHAAANPRSAREYAERSASSHAGAGTGGGGGVRSARLTSHVEPHAHAYMAAAHHPYAPGMVEPDPYAAAAGHPQHGYAPSHAYGSSQYDPGQYGSSQYGHAHAHEMAATHHGGHPAPMTHDPWLDSGLYGHPLHGYAPHASYASYPPQHAVLQSPQHRYHAYHAVEDPGYLYMVGPGAPGASGGGGGGGYGYDRRPPHPHDLAYMGRMPTHAPPINDLRYGDPRAAAPYGYHRDAMPPHGATDAAAAAAAAAVTAAGGGASGAYAFGGRHAGHPMHPDHPAMVYSPHAASGYALPDPEAGGHAPAPPMAPSHGHGYSDAARPPAHPASATRPAYPPHAVAARAAHPGHRDDHGVVAAVLPAGAAAAMAPGLPGYAMPAPAPDDVGPTRSAETSRRSAAHGYGQGGHGVGPPPVPSVPSSPSRLADRHASSRAPVLTEPAATGARLDAPSHHPAAPSPAQRSDHGRATAALEAGTGMAAAAATPRPAAPSGAVGVYAPTSDAPVRRPDGGSEPERPSPRLSEPRTRSSVPRGASAISATIAPTDARKAPSAPATAVGSRPSAAPWPAAPLAGPVSAAPIATSAPIPLRAAARTEAAPALAALGLDPARRPASQPLPPGPSWSPMTGTVPAPPQPQLRPAPTPTPTPRDAGAGVTSVASFRPPSPQWPGDTQGVRTATSPPRRSAALPPPPPPLTPPLSKTDRRPPSPPRSSHAEAVQAASGPSAMPAPVPVRFRDAAQIPPGSPLRGAMAVSRSSSAPPALSPSAPASPAAPRSEASLQILVAPSRSPSPSMALASSPPPPMPMPMPKSSPPKSSPASAAAAAAPADADDLPRGAAPRIVPPRAAIDAAPSTVDLDVLYASRRVDPGPLLPRTAIPEASRQQLVAFLRRASAAPAPAPAPADGDAPAASLIRSTLHAYVAAVAVSPAFRASATAAVAGADPDPDAAPPAGTAAATAAGAAVAVASHDEGRSLVVRPLIAGRRKREAEPAAPPAAKRPARALPGGADGHGLLAPPATRPPPAALHQWVFDVYVPTGADTPPVRATTLHVKQALTKRPLPRFDLRPQYLVSRTDGAALCALIRERLSPIGLALAEVPPAAATDRDHGGGNSDGGDGDDGDGDGNLSARFLDEMSGLRRSMFLSLTLAGSDDAWELHIQPQAHPTVMGYLCRTADLDAALHHACHQYLVEQRLPLLVNVDFLLAQPIRADDPLAAAHPERVVVLRPGQLVLLAPDAVAFLRWAAQAFVVGLTTARDDAYLTRLRRRLDPTGETITGPCVSTRLEHAWIARYTRDQPRHVAALAASPTHRTRLGLCSLGPLPPAARAAPAADAALAVHALDRFYPFMAQRAHDPRRAIAPLVLDCTLAGWAPNARRHVLRIMGPAPAAAAPVTKPDAAAVYRAARARAALDADLLGRARAALAETHERFFLGFAVLGPEADDDEDRRGGRAPGSRGGPHGAAPIHVGLPLLDCLDVAQRRQ
ncbi:hypothetical protein CXG81DRAFT_26296 [Caulochytrium protostelioides]|uniref:Uncharacterized protein n=1 Tax=Caulochytrium protostelioides TaxID=1555241 RepID=A0A4P9X717_9FUNG|nr:hypothetical protein CXG81DRAFT_26296 [Caulochytrium protostelioides]|eukprot:RKP00992.1 hypothetical protein CXG81DRAFT_26296 [Caulochytrium protostelioides]